MRQTASEVDFSRSTTDGEHSSAGQVKEPIYLPQRVDYQGGIF